MRVSKAKEFTKTFFNIIDLIFYSVLFYYFLNLQYEDYYPVKMEIPNFTQMLNAHYKAFIISVFFWYIIANNTKLYGIEKGTSFFKIILTSSHQVFIFIPVLFTISGLKQLPLFESSNILLFSLLIFIFIVITRLMNRIFFYKEKNNNILFIGKNSRSNEIKDFLLKNKLGNIYEISSSHEEFMSVFDSYVKNNKISKIFIVRFNLLPSDIVKHLLNLCEDYQIEVNIIPYSINDNIVAYGINYIKGIQVLKIKRYPLDEEINKFIKLLVDKLISSFVIVFIMSWLYPILAILIKLDSKGNVLFKQKRTGVNGRIFDCYKFRTMHNDGTNSIKATIINDNRITKVGSFLRKTSLDEFPQFFNVLKGDMSIVGPRPHMISVDEQYSKMINRYYFRYYIKPGITGLSQVNGFRGDMNEENMNDRIRTDIFYIKNWSFLLDIKILVKTFLVVFKGDENAI
ncbi:exopolysaccharide biosynthesis polyprenyl glycosylphosphotransferase [Empedobacter tilapiae]